MQYVSALVAYDGSDYHGFQYQANAASIQCELEAALDKVAERVRTRWLVQAARMRAYMPAAR